MKKICLWTVIIAVVSTLLMLCSGCALKVQAVEAVEKSLKQGEIPYSNVALNGKQIQIGLTSDSTGKCSEQDVKNLMFVFHSLQNSEHAGDFDEAQVKITDHNGEVIYNTIQRVSFSGIQRTAHSTEKLDDTCGKIKEQITKSGIEPICQYSTDMVFDVPRVNFSVTYAADDSPSVDVNELYNLIITDISQNCDIGYCTLRINNSKTNEDDLYLEGDCDLNLLLAWMSPELSSRMGPPTEKQFDRDESSEGDSSVADGNEIAGTVRFYSEPTAEFTEPNSYVLVELSAEQVIRIETLLNSIHSWTNDYIVDRNVFYFNGDIKLSSLDDTYFFSYENNIVYYDHYFAELSEEGFKIIEGLREMEIDRDESGEGDSSVANGSYRIKYDLGKTETHFSNNPSEAKAGDLVEIKTNDILYDADIHVYVDGQEIGKTHYDSDYWGYSFVMPDRDVLVTAMFYSKDEIWGLSPDENALKEKYPEYFGLSTAKGLEVYVWQMAPNSYSFGVLPVTNREKTAEEMWKMKGATAKEMRLILSTYDIDQNDICIVPWQNPISSHISEYWIIQKDEDSASVAKRQQEYIAAIRTMLFGSDGVYQS